MVYTWKRKGGQKRIILVWIPVRIAITVVTILSHFEIWSKWRQLFFSDRWLWLDHFNETWGCSFFWLRPYYDFFAPFQNTAVRAALFATCVKLSGGVVLTLTVECFFSSYTFICAQLKTPLWILPYAQRRHHANRQPWTTWEILNPLTTIALLFWGQFAWKSR